MEWKVIMDKILNLKKEEFAAYFDQTLLQADASESDFKKLCEESKVYGFKMVAINPAAVTVCKKYLKGSKVLAGAAVGFPLGQNTIETKVFETVNAIENGAGEIDYVINISELKNRNYDYIEREMHEIAEICRKKDITSKVIFENCYLTDEEKVKLCKIALSVGPDYIKTSTGFGSGGADISDVILMKGEVGEKIKVKASGGIRTFETACKFIEAGACRIGTSVGVGIVDEFIKMKKEKREVLQ